MYSATTFERCFWRLLIDSTPPLSRQTLLKYFAETFSTALHRKYHRLRPIKLIPLPRATPCYGQIITKLSPLPRPLTCRSIYSCCLVLVDDMRTPFSRHGFPRGPTRSALHSRAQHALALRHSPIQPARFPQTRTADSESRAPTHSGAAATNSYRPLLSVTPNSEPACFQKLPSLYPSARSSKLTRQIVRPTLPEQRTALGDRQQQTELGGHAPHAEARRTTPKQPALLRRRV